MIENLKTLLTNPQIFPVEVVLVSGHTIPIRHPDFVFMSPTRKGFFLVSQMENDPHAFEWIDFQFVASVRGRAKKSFWTHFFGSKE